jgi:hypothetical protein
MVFRCFAARDSMAGTAYIAILRYGRSDGLMMSVSRSATALSALCVQKGRSWNHITREASAASASGSRPPRSHGEYAAYAQPWVWQALGRGRYVAYEPQEACRPRLMGSSVPGLTIIQSAMSDQSGEMDLLRCRRQRPRFAIRAVGDLSAAPNPGRASASDNGGRGAQGSRT